MSMNLEQAAKLVDEKDSKLYFTRIHNNFGFKYDANLVDYLEAIQKDPIKWFENFPGEIKSATSFAKPKTVIIKVLKNDEVHNGCGDRLCRDLLDNITRTFKTEEKNILKRREAARALTPAEQEVPDMSSDEDEGIVDEVVAVEVVKTEIVEQKAVKENVAKVAKKMVAAPAETVAELQARVIFLEQQVKAIKSLAISFTYSMEKCEYRKEMIELVMNS